MNLICSKNAMTQLKLHNNSPLHVVSITQCFLQNDGTEHRSENLTTN